MDNLTARKVPGVRAEIQARGAKLLGPWPRASMPDPGLPPHSPDLNPMEQAFAKLEALLRNAGERTVGALSTTIGGLLERFSTAECANYLVTSGYPRSA